MLCGLLPAILKVSKIYQSLTENGLFLTNPVCGVTKSFKFGLFMSCKEGKDSLLLKFNKGTLFSIYHLELKKELLRTPQYHVIHQKFFHWIWYLNLVWCVPYAKFWVQAKKHIKIHVFYNTGNFSQLIIIIMVFIFTVIGNSAKTITKFPGNKKYSQNDLKYSISPLRHRLYWGFHLKTSCSEGTS